MSILVHTFMINTCLYLLTIRLCHKTHTMQNPHNYINNHSSAPSTVTLFQKLFNAFLQEFREPILFTVGSKKSKIPGFMQHAVLIVCCSKVIFSYRLLSKNLLKDFDIIGGCLKWTNVRLFSDLCTRTGKL